jgi:gliding motility-associated-like protein
LTYTPGTQISTVGRTNIQVRFSRSGCPDALICGTPPTTYTWIIVPPLVSPTLTKVPNLTSICEGTAVKAILTPGSGGANCSDILEYRKFNGTTWTAWAAYVSNTNINSVGLTTVEIRTYRGNCAANSLCAASDTALVTWNIFPQPVAPVLAKQPSGAIVCEGVDVSATLTSAGTGGAGCSDVFQYRTNNGSGYSAWLPYTPPTAIPTTGLTAIQIISYRGDCDPGSFCIQTAVDTLKWNVTAPVTDPSITRIPDGDTLCISAIISAIVTPATGGTGCTNYSQYRLKVGAIWTGWINYTSGNTINHGANVSEVQIRAFRGNCAANSGCTTSDTAFVKWIFSQEPVGPVMQKNPNVLSVCDGSSVNATLLTSGSGGYGCSDVINYRTNNGSGYSAWLAYTPGTPIPTTGLTRIQIVSYRGNCNPLAGCSQSTADSILWVVLPDATNPSIARTPDEDTLCSGTLLSATITNGTGGQGCSNFSESRTYNGTIWSAWTTYNSGAVVPYASDVIRVEVRAFRGNCDVAAGCSGSDTISVFWNINPQPIAPILAKNPNVMGVCAGTSVSATITTPGSGGVGCSDNTEYRIHNGTSWSAWLSYTPGTPITTTGLTQVEIRSWRGACPIVGCHSTDTTTLNWTVNVTTTEPAIARTPDQDFVCQGTLVSATITSGTGGTGCNDVSEFRTMTTGIWAPWAAYTSTNTINTVGIDSVEVRTYRLCPPATGCPSTDTNMVFWQVANTLIMPVLAKVPNTDSICESTMIGANMVTAGSGGTGCIDIYEISTDAGLTWNPYTPGTMTNSTGLTDVRIRFTRGGCPEATLCGAVPTEFKWIIVPQAIAPLIVKNPNIDGVCEGTPLSGTITPGSGGVGCTDTYEKRTNNGTTWSAWTAYTSGTNINTAGVDTVQIRVFRGNCNPLSGCFSTDTTIINWNVYPQPIAPVLAGNPNVSTVCEGTDVSASLTTPGSGGAGCSDTFEYRVDNGAGYGAWTPYAPPTLISTTGVVAVQIISYRGNCDPASLCVQTPVDTITWAITPPVTDPVIVKTPNIDTLCTSNVIFATITPATGGIGCTDYSQYRLKVGAIWTGWINYTSGNIINHGANVGEVQVRAFRGNCLSNSGCGTSDTAFVSWIFTPDPVGPILQRTPDISPVCVGSDVSAILVTPGSGGSGCSDVINFRVDNGSGYGAWSPYVPGTLISTTGLTSIQIVSQRGNCNPLANCTETTADTIFWVTMAGTTDPTIARVPDMDTVCYGTSISASITDGTGGSGCSNFHEYRMFDGALWSAWTNYINNAFIPYGVTTTQIEVRAFRGNCDPLAGCLSSDTALVHWVITPQPVNPILNKLPNIAGVCEGADVSATLLTPGTSTNGCGDVFEFRTDNGGGYSAWAPYTLGTAINTTGLTFVQIIGYSDNCSGMCTPPVPDTLTWFVAPQPIGPTIARHPDVDSLCAGPILSGTITPGSGGAGCSDVYEYRLKDTLGVWTAWMPYISDSLIHTDTISGAQIKVSRTNCFVGSGCTEPAPIQIEWVVFPQPIVPVLTKIPDQDAVCETTLLTAVQTGDAGGVPPTTIIYQYENPGEWTWNPGNSFVPNSNGMAYIRARSSSNGYGCIDSDWEWVSWIVDPKPVITAPADQTICENGSTILDAVVTGGYGVITYGWEMSTSSCTGPWTPVTDSTRASLETGPLSDTTWYRITATQQATSCSDVSSCIAVNVKPAPVVTISGITTVCSGGTELIATVANEPNPVVYQWQFSNLATGPWTNTGSDNDTLTIPTVIGSLYYQCVVTGDTVGCSASSAATLVVAGSAPVITYNSSDTSICNGGNLFLNVVAQAIPTPTYQWYGPLGIIAGATSDTLYLNNVQATDNGTYYCEVMSFCDTVVTPNIQVNVMQNLIAATTISGTLHRCQGAGFDQYTTDAVNVSSNIWSITPPTAGTVNTSGFVAWDAGFAGTAQITVGTVGCDTTLWTSLNVLVDSTVQTPTISGTPIRCQGNGSDQYTATAPGATSFVWNISNAGASTIDPVTGMVNWDSTFFGTATIIAYANGCGGPSESGQFDVQTLDSVTFIQSGPQHICINDSNALWVSPSLNMGNSYQWFDQVGEITGETDTMLVFNPAQLTDQGLYYCRIVTICGDTLFSTPDSITVHPLPVVDFSYSGVCRLDTTFFTNLSTVTDGTISYQWMFGDGNTSTNMNPTHIYLVADTFGVVLTATTSWGCTQTASQQLIIHDLPQATVATIGDSCNSSGTGSIIISPTFGTYPFSYNLSGQTAQPDSIFTPLPAGQYWVTVTDSNNCRTTLPAIVTQPNLLKTHIYPTNVLCYDDSSGVARVEVTGGTQPYQYIWTNGQVSADLTNVPVGNYGVLVTDANGCFAIDSVTLIQPNPLIVDSLLVQPSCLQLNDGKIFVFVSGGSGLYDYLWSTGSVLDSIINLTPNTYQITITDANGCKSVHEYIINENNNDCLTIWTSFSPDGDGTNDVWNIGHIELYPECVVQIFNRWGAQLFESKGYSQPWDGTWHNKALPAETYYFVVNLGDGSDPITGTVTIIR